MKIFISWSGKRSLAVAEIMSDWIKCVLQASQPWISTRHIERGSLWFSEINEKLRDVSVGIVCLTQENKDKPWILFETGALAKGLTGSRVCTFLIDLSPSDLVDPLAQFNHTQPNEQSVKELVKTLNVCLGDQALEERVLEKIFDVYWPSFLEDFTRALSENPQNEVVAPRNEKDILAEILDNTRSLGRRVAMLEKDRPEHDVIADAQVKGASMSSKMAYRNRVLYMVRRGDEFDEIKRHLFESNLSPSLRYQLIKYAEALISEREIEVVPLNEAN